MYSKNSKLKNMLNIIEHSLEIEVLVDYYYMRLEKIRLEKAQWAFCPPGQSNLASKQGVYTTLAHRERIEKERVKITAQLAKCEDDLEEVDEFLKRLVSSKAHKYIIYRFRYGMNNKEISEVTKATETAINASIKRALNKIKEEGEGNE